MLSGKQGRICHEQPHDRNHCAVRKGCWRDCIVRGLLAGMAAAIKDDNDRLRYRELHALVRADGDIIALVDEATA